MNALSMIHRCAQHQNVDGDGAATMSTRFESCVEPPELAIEHAGAIDGYRRWQDGEEIVNDAGERVTRC